VGISVSSIKAKTIFITAYRVCTHIAKSLQSCCQAICNAVDAYNTAAAALTPPRPYLDWSAVSHYQFLDEFELLQDTKNDICLQPWAQPAIQETIKQFNRVKRAHEEISNCNIEIRWLHTSIIDEHTFFDNILAKLRGNNSILLGVVQDYTSH
jgi:hypothetical protein